MTRNKFSKIGDTGSVLIEAALIFPILVLTFISLVEFMNYLDQRNKVEKLTTQIGNVLSSLTPNEWSNNGVPTDVIDLLNNTTRAMSFGMDGFRVAIRFCQGDRGTGAMQSRVYTAGSGNGSCGASGRPGSPEVDALTVACDDIVGSANGAPLRQVSPATQFVAIAGGCAYRPMLLSGLFEDGAMIRLNNHYPMRRPMNWFGSREPNSAFQFSVNSVTDSTRMFTSTDIFVKAGDKVVVSYLEGSWTYRKQDSSAGYGNGFSSGMKFGVSVGFPDQTCSGLQCAKDAGVKYSNGENYIEFIADKDGYIYTGAIDWKADGTWLNDNDGKVTANIKVNP